MNKIIKSVLFGDIIETIKANVFRVVILTIAFIFFWYIGYAIVGKVTAGLFFGIGLLLLAEVAVVLIVRAWKKK